MQVSSTMPRQARQFQRTTAILQAFTKIKQFPKTAIIFPAPQNRLDPLGFCSKSALIVVA
jgi:hypothetical protein